MPTITASIPSRARSCKAYFLDHDHSAYVDQWDREKAITSNQHTLEYLKTTVRVIWCVLAGAKKHVQKLFPRLHDPRYSNLPDELTFLHAEDILEMYPDLPCKQRETAILQKCPRSSSSESAGP